MCSADTENKKPKGDATLEESGSHAMGTPSGCVSQGFATNLMLSLLAVIAICAIIMVTELGSVVRSEKLELDNMQSASNTITVDSPSFDTNQDFPDVVAVDSGNDVESQHGATSGESFVEPNICEGKKPDLPDTECIVDAMVNVGPQAGANVTKGYQGKMNVTEVPITVPYSEVGMCPVNVHWHEGAEHLSVGEYDENGVGPAIADELDGDGVRQGHRCMLYDENDARFNTPYEWKFCHNMQVGETYEVHWPHSAAGACGTSNQYQTPFYDGVFCIDGILTDTASQIGVQSQVFTVINDDSYYYPDMIQGMIVDGDTMGVDVAKYTGSTTGDKRNNEICSQYSPITWQVDRKCHLISASSFDKLCYDMLQMNDDMSGDTHPHGARQTVSDNLAANNHQGRFLRSLRAGGL